MAAVLFLFFLAKLVSYGLFGSYRFLETVFRNIRPPFILIQIGGNQGKHLLHRCRAVQIDPGIGGMVVSPVLFAELFISQRRNGFRFPAAVVSVAGVRKKLAHDLPVDQCIRIAHGAFHFVKDNTPVDIFPVFVSVHMPAFLAESFPVPECCGIENSVQVYAGQVQDIPGIPAGNRKHGHV